MFMYSYIIFQFICHIIYLEYNYFVQESIFSLFYRFGEEIDLGFQRYNRLEVGCYSFNAFTLQNIKNEMCKTKYVTIQLKCKQHGTRCYSLLCGLKSSNDSNHFFCQSSKNFVYISYKIKKIYLILCLTFIHTLHIYTSFRQISYGAGKRLSVIYHDPDRLTLLASYS